MPSRFLKCSALSLDAPGAKCLTCEGIWAWEEQTSELNLQMWESLRDARCFTSFGRPTNLQGRKQLFTIKTISETKVHFVGCVLENRLLVPGWLSSNWLRLASFSLSTTDCYDDIVAHQCNALQMDTSTHGVSLTFNLQTGWGLNLKAAFSSAVASSNSHLSDCSSNQL